MKSNKPEGESRFWSFFNQQHSGESIINMVMSFFNYMQSQPKNNMIMEAPRESDTIGINVQVIDKPDDHQMYVVVDKNMPITELTEYIAKMYESNFSMDNELETTDSTTKRKQPRYKCPWVKKYNAGRILKQYLVKDVIFHEEFIEAKIIFDDVGNNKLSNHSEGQNTLPLETPCFNQINMSAELEKKGQIELEPQDLNQDVKGYEALFKAPKKSKEDKKIFILERAIKKNIGDLKNETKKNKDVIKKPKKIKESKKSSKHYEDDNKELIKFPSLLSQMSDDIDINKNIDQKEELNNFFTTMHKASDKNKDVKNKARLDSKRSDKVLPSKVKLLNKRSPEEADSISDDFVKPVKKLETQSVSGFNQNCDRSPMDTPHILRKTSGHIQRVGNFLLPVHEPTKKPSKEKKEKIKEKKSEKKEKKSEKKEKKSKKNSKNKIVEETQDTDFVESKNEAIKLAVCDNKNDVSNVPKKDHNVVVEISYTHKDTEIFDDDKMLEEDLKNIENDTKDQKIVKKKKKSDSEKKAKKKSKKHDKSEAKQAVDALDKSTPKTSPMKNKKTQQFDTDRKKIGDITDEFIDNGLEQETPFKTCRNYYSETDDFKENSSDSFRQKINNKLAPIKKSSIDLGEIKMEVRKLSSELKKAESEIKESIVDLEMKKNLSSDFTFAKNSFKDSKKNSLKLAKKNESYEFDDKMATYLQAEKSSDSYDSSDSEEPKKNVKPEYMKSKLKSENEKSKKKKSTEKLLKTKKLSTKLKSEKVKIVSSSDPSSSSEDEKEIRKNLIISKKNTKKNLVNQNDSKKNSLKKPEAHIESESSENDNKKGKTNKNKVLKKDSEKNDYESSHSEEDPKKLSLIKKNISKGLFFDDSDSSSDESDSEEKNKKNVPKKIVKKNKKLKKNESGSESSDDSDTVKKPTTKLKQNKGKSQKVKVTKKDISDSSSDDSEKITQNKKKKVSKNVVKNQPDSDDSSSEDIDSSCDDDISQTVSQTSNIMHKKFDRHSNIFQKHKQKVANFRN